MIQNSSEKEISPRFIQTLFQGPHDQETADLVTFTEEILNEKLIFCTVENADNISFECSVCCWTYMKEVVKVS